MSITSLQRNFTGGSNVVYMQSTDSYGTIVGATYLDDQADNIITTNMGPFDWVNNDLVVAYCANDARFIFQYNANTGSLMPYQGVLAYESIAITAAEFNGMYAAPKLLVSAPGADTLIIVERSVLTMTYNSLAYAAGGIVALQYDSTANGAGVPATATVAAADFQATASTSFMLQGVLSAAPFSTTVNKGLYLSNQTGAFTTGNSPFVAHVWYRTVATV